MRPDRAVLAVIEIVARPGAHGAAPAAPVTTPTDAREDDAGGGHELVCATSERTITHDDHRIEVGGAHEHTFVNPGGDVHHLGCFRAATGLRHVGAPEAAFSWFPGFDWQLAFCAGCHTHLGWLYRCAGDSFHGLLLAQLLRR
ncbi:MAG TPA: cereblon family protein [Kofleriaceae bacterium]|nr:cereblon family protein [Kofleriaceae bacterium]